MNRIVLKVNVPYNWLKPRKEDVIRLLEQITEAYYQSDNWEIVTVVKDFDKKKKRKSK